MISFLLNMEGKASCKRLSLATHFLISVARVALIISLSTRFNYRNVKVVNNRHILPVAMRRNRKFPFISYGHKIYVLLSLTLIGS